MTEALQNQLDRLKQRREDLKSAIADKKREMARLQKKRSQALENQLRPVRSRLSAAERKRRKRRKRRTRRLIVLGSLLEKQHSQQELIALPWISIARTHGHNRDLRYKSRYRSRTLIPMVLGEVLPDPGNLTHKLSSSPIEQEDKHQDHHVNDQTQPAETPTEKIEIERAVVWIHGILLLLCSTL